MKLCNVPAPKMFSYEFINSLIGENGMTSKTSFGNIWFRRGGGGGGGCIDATQRAIRSKRAVQRCQYDKALLSNRFAGTYNN